MKSSDRIVLRATGARPVAEMVPQRREAAARLLATVLVCRHWEPDAARAERLRTLRQAVASGTYRIDYERTALALLADLACGAPV